MATRIDQGKSDHGIAEATTIGVRTIETYVTRIITKLGFDSRLQIAHLGSREGTEDDESTGVTEHTARRQSLGREGSPVRP